MYLLTIFQLYERHEKQGETDDFGINFVQKEKHKKIKGEYNKNFSQMESHDLFWERSKNLFFYELDFFFWN